MTKCDEELSGLAEEERREVKRYIEIFTEEGFKEHWQVNEWISRYDSWDNFPSIRSLNDHVRAKGVRGIMPKYFKIVCRVLEIKGSGGSPLIKVTPY